MLLTALIVAGTPDLKAYRSWTCVTPQAVDMAPAIAMSCVGPASWDADPKNPHLRKRFKVWVNPVGRATMAKPTMREVKPGEWAPVPVNFPEGTVIVKEKYDAMLEWQKPGAQKVRPLPIKPELLTIMLKGKPGSKPRTGDWTYLVADAQLKKIDLSQETRCASCHAAKATTDYIFRGYGTLTH